MHSSFLPAVFALLLLPAAALAQVGPQTAAVDTSTSAAPSSAATASRGGITRDQFINRAQDRAAQRAAARFDQMDADHDGVLDRAEIRAWRSEHPRRPRGQANQPTPQ
jgi:hypothetical protein